MTEIAVILLRGRIGLRAPVKHTLDMMGLYRKHACAVIIDSPSARGMLQKVKDCVTWGTIDKETKKTLAEKRKSADGKHFALHPPRGGFGKKGIKKPFASGGNLGNRKDAINDLIKRML